MQQKVEMCFVWNRERIYFVFGKTHNVHYDDFLCGILNSVVCNGVVARVRPEVGVQEMPPLPNSSLLT